MVQGNGIRRHRIPDCAEVAPRSAAHRDDEVRARRLRTVAQAKHLGANQSCCPVSLGANEQRVGRGPNSGGKRYICGRSSGHVSEYPHYEFQAIDRPLDEADKKALRRISSRAEITSTRFTNVYYYRDFRGRPRKLMERWFDLHLYLANWGTRSLMVRLPKRLVDRSQLDRCVQAVPEIEVLESGENLIVEITLDSEDSGLYFFDTEGEGWLDSIAPLRSGALAGDLGLFYVLWLTAVERGIVRDHAKEPLPGIGPLSAAQVTRRVLQR